MIKKILLLTILLFSGFTLASPTGSFYINTVNSDSGYFSFKIHASAPSNNYKLEGVPENIQYIITSINNFIVNNHLNHDENAYAEFGYSDGINSTQKWFTKKPCYFKLYKNNQSVTVTLSKNTNGSYTCLAS